MRVGPKRRGIYWTKIKAGIKGTVFEEIIGEEVVSFCCFFVVGFWGLVGGRFVVYLFVYI